MYTHIVTTQRCFICAHFATVARIALCLLMVLSYVFPHITNFSECFSTLFTCTNWWMFCVCIPQEMSRNTACTFVLIAIGLVRMNYLFLL